MKQYLGEIIIALIGIAGNLITFYTTKRTEQKKASKEVESIRLANDREDEKYKGEILSSQQKMFNVIKQLQNDQISLRNAFVEQSAEVSKLKASNLILDSDLKRVQDQNKLLRKELNKLSLEYEKLSKEHKELMDKYREVKNENVQLKLKLK